MRRRGFIALLGAGLAAPGALAKGAGEAASLIPEAAMNVTLDMTAAPFATFYSPGGLVGSITTTGAKAFYSTVIDWHEPSVPGGE